METAMVPLVLFLRDFVTSMVADIDKLTIEEASKKAALAAFRLTKPPQLEEPSTMQFSMTYYNEPFSPPPTFNVRTIDQLIEIVIGKQAETQDHLRLLQTDSTYFSLTCFVLDRKQRCHFLWSRKNEKGRKGECA